MTAGPPNQPATTSPRGSVRLKVGLVVGGAMLLVLGLSMWTSSHLLMHLFGAQQDRLTRDKLERVVICLNKLAEAKMKSVRDSAQWDEAYDYVEGMNPSFLTANFGPDVNTSGQDLVMAFDRNRNLVGAVQTRLVKPRPLSSDIDFPALVRSRLFQNMAASGLLVSKNRVLLLASCPINNSAVTGSTNGWLIFGTYLDKERTAEVAELAGARLKIARLEALSPINSSARQEIFPTGALAPVKGLYEPATSLKATERLSRALLFFPTLTEDEAVGVEVWVSTLVYNLALETKFWMFVVSCAVALVLLAVGLSAFEISILQPLASLDREMRRISSVENSEVFLKVRGRSEIGRLAQSANRLLYRARIGRKEAEEQKELLSSVINSASEGVVAFLIKRDAWGEIEDFVYVLVNASAEKMIGRKAETLIGRTLLKEFPSLKMEIFERYCRAVKKNRLESFESYFEDGHIKAWFNISATPWKEGLVLTFEDITERKTREKQLQETLEEIERFNSAMIGREERVLEMKKEVNALRSRLGQPPIYQIPSDDV